MKNELRATLNVGPEAFARLQAAWDTLLDGSSFNTIFLTHGWLTACIESYGQRRTLLVPTVWDGDELVAAAAFLARDEVVDFAGGERSDYLTVLLSRKLTRSCAEKATLMILEVAAGAAEKFREFELKAVPDVDCAKSIIHGVGKFRAFVTNRIESPTMDMANAANAVRKKSLVRHEKRLDKLGCLTCETFSRATDIEPRLDEFFEQHVRRWGTTPYPSLFEAAESRQFYRRLTQDLDHSGKLRFTELRLDERLIAAHYGFCHAGVFTWYKPTFEPELAKMSPGEVLIKRLIERASEEGCSEFDFTMGNESFKRRFATRYRQVVFVRITDSRLKAAQIWTRLRAREAVSLLKGALVGKGRNSNSS